MLQILSPKLVLHIPLKSADHSFTLYKIITLPERISPDKFVQYAVDYPYLAVQVSQPGYIPFTETTVDAFQVASLYARWIQQYLINKILPVPLVSSSRVHTVNKHVREIYSSTTNSQR